jgi:hypothetical protein
MVVCDENGMVYDIWFKFLTENFEFIGDKGCKGCKYVKVCEDKQEKSKKANH